MLRSTSQSSRLTSVYRACSLGVLVLLAVGPAHAVESPQRSGVAEKEFRHPDLDISTILRLPAELPAGEGASMAAADLAALGVPADRGRLDARGGRWAAITPSQPLLPGRGVGNELTWDGLGHSTPGSDVALRTAAGRAFREYVKSNAVQLRVDVAELAGDGVATVHESGAVTQVYVPRVVRGVPVRGSYLTAVINHGNLVLFGASNWGDVDVSTRAGVPIEEALTTVQAHVDPFTVSGSWGKSELILVPTARGKDGNRIRLGKGYDHRLAWLIRPTFAGELGHWEALVDAHSSELISFADTNQHVATPRRVQGGVYPVSNDGAAPDGVEQAGWPMPFDNVATPSGTVTTDAGGNLPAPVDGNITSNLSGQFVNINDNCGAISLTSSGDIDFGTSGGTDCATPGFGGAGNTHASRTGFHELNRIIEMGRGQLPGNTWLQQTLTSNMNINLTCNAFWGGGTVNFYRSGGGCFNTGEIAGVFDHEWGHGLDDNDAVPTIASPSGEGIADIYTALRLNTSCIGRGFRATNCTGFGDPCLNCTGVRDIDYLQRQSGQPHDYSWSNANCGGSVHCVGGVYAEAVWSLWKRELQSAPYNMDNNTALEVVTRLTYIGAGNTGTWFSGGPPNGGCSGTSGYMNYLAADDDNGNLNDGTPHMWAIFNAFDDQEIACGTPTVQDAGCAGNPSSAPLVTVTPFDKSVNMSWGPVANATGYEVFRTDGVFACDFGKVKVGETTGTSFNDSGLQNGRTYSYVVLPIGAADSCFGPSSGCASVTPSAGPNLDVDPNSAVLAILTGDGDEFLDNCEEGSLTFDVNNTGLGSLTNVRVVGVTPISHPATVVTTTFPAAVSPSTLAEGVTGNGSFEFIAEGLSFNDTLTFQVEVTADELAVSKFQNLSVSSTESDFVTFASKTFSFEADLEDWAVAQGTFNRSSALGGGGGTNWGVESSTSLDNQCDRIRSPLMRLQSTSTLSLETNYDIEPLSSGTWYDRANIGVIDGGGSRTLVTPDGGRLYNANSSGPGNYSGCNEPEEGWAGAAASWAGSAWSATALQSGTFAGQQVQLEVVYGTDGALANRGFSYDEVTVTDVDFQEADGQSDVCGPPPCGDGTCDATSGEDQCSCAVDCGTPPGSEAGLCTDLIDNDCDLAVDCADADCAGDPSCVVACDNDGVCEAGEDCNNCSNDCIGGTTPGAVCGNGLCETADGEDCVSCSADCNGVQNGKPSGRFCCGNGGTNPVGCGDSRCFDGGLQCTTDPAPSGSYCCGDASCDAPEDGFSCEIDCGPPPCGDGFCDPASEDQCSCAADCGLPPSSEVGLCTDGIDNDCGGGTDCGDADCGSDPACICLPRNASCSLGSECCSGICKNNGRCR